MFIPTLHEYAAIIRSVYDADTVRADIDQGFSNWRHNEPLRLYGINAPEMTGADRPRGIAARDTLRGWIENKNVWLQTHKSDSRDKYGRYLAIIWTLDGLNVNAELVTLGLAVPFMVD